MSSILVEFPPDSKADPDEIAHYIRCSLEEMGIRLTVHIVQGQQQNDNDNTKN